MGWTLAAPSAHAGTYTLTYSGGQTVAVGVGTASPGTTVTTLYSANYDGNSNYGGSAGVSWYNRTASVTCSKPITATATWQPSDPNDTPPSCVIVKQVGTARYDGQGFGAATPPGKCADGLGDAEVKTGTSAPQPGPPPTFHGVSTGTRWSGTDSPGASFALSTTPSASVSGTGTDGPPSVSGSGSASVSSAATVYPVTITPSGLTLVNGVKKVLTGQPITVSLDPLPAGCSASNYQWDIESTSGGSLVGGYLAAQGIGMTTPPSPLNSPSVTFYDGIQDTVVVNLTVTITFPDGTTDTAMATAMVAVVKPTATMSGSSLDESDNFVQAHLHPNDTAPVYGANEKFGSIKITMPTGFTGGYGCIVQKIQSTTRIDMRQTGSNYIQQEKQSGGTWIAIPALCLDTNFPYPFASPWAVTDTGTGTDGGDLPGVQCAPPLVNTDTGKSDWNASSGNDQFMDWIMYNFNPQSSSDIWVPLSTFAWGWSSQASLNTTTSTWSVSNFQPSSNSNALTASGEWPTWTTWAPYSGTGELAMRP